MVLLNAAGVRKKADGNLSIVAMTFLIVRVDHGVRNLIPSFMVPVEPHEQNQTLIGYHSRLISGKVDAAISIDEEFYDIPASFQAADSEVEPWMMISSMCKLESVLLMKKTHVRITLRSPIQARKPLEKKDALEVMRQRSKDCVPPDLKPTTAIKNRKKGLWNAIVKWLATMSIGWNRDEVASAGNLFVTTMTEIFGTSERAKQNLLPVHARYHFSSSNFLDSISRKLLLWSGDDLAEVVEGSQPICESCKDKNKPIIKKRKRNIVGEKRNKRATTGADGGRGD